VDTHGDQDVIIGEHVLDSHKGKQLVNMGRPVYIAVVRDQSQAVGHLIKAGADVNCVHPVHGDTCLLHASQNGYDECLQVLLKSKALKPTSHLTIDRKIFLGQGMPQWEEGGQCALMVAACNGRVEAVKLLLLRNDALEHWMTCSDTFGRTALQATFDSIALCKEGAKLDDFKAIARLLLQQKGVENIETELTSSIPDCAEAEERQRERILAVRARCLAAEQTRKDAERRRGLEAIAEHYAPLHPETMDVTAIHSASSGGTAIVSEPLPGVFSFPLLSADMCRKVWEELHHYESTACNNPAWDLPLRVRHDGNLGDLQDCGLQPLLDVVLASCRPILQQHMPDLGEVEAYHAFVTRNYEGREENATFKMHCDKVSAYAPATRCLVLMRHKVLQTDSFAMSVPGTAWCAAKKSELCLVLMRNQVLRLASCVWY